jgi:hypothetical protein
VRETPRCECRLTCRCACPPNPTSPRPRPARTRCWTAATSCCSPAWPADSLKRVSSPPGRDHLLGVGHLRHPDPTASKSQRRSTPERPNYALPRAWARRDAAATGLSTRRRQARTSNGQQSPNALVEGQQQRHSQVTIRGVARLSGLRRLGAGRGSLPLPGRAGCLVSRAGLDGDRVSWS